MTDDAHDDSRPESVSQFDDALMAALGALPGGQDEAAAALDLAPLDSAQMGRALRAAFMQTHRIAAHRRDEPSWPETLARLYHRGIEPAAVTAFGAGYLVWAFDRVLTLL